MPNEARRKGDCFKGRDTAEVSKLLRQNANDNVVSLRRSSVKISQIPVREHVAEEKTNEAEEESHPPAWTKERMILLRSMWDAGHSATEIAERLGPWFTRNSVIGKIRREKFPARKRSPTSTVVHRISSPSPDKYAYIPISTNPEIFIDSDTTEKLTAIVINAGVPMSRAQELVALFQEILIDATRDTPTKLPKIHAVLRTGDNFVSRALNEKLPKTAPALWKNRFPNETPPEFIKRNYSRWLEIDGSGLVRAHLRTLDPTLYGAIAEWTKPKWNNTWPDDCPLPKQREATDALLEKSGVLSMDGVALHRLGAATRYRQKDSKREI